LKLRVITFGFILFLIAAVIIANTGNGHHFWSFIHQIPGGDKLGHIGLFFTLSFLSNLAFPSRIFGPRPFLISLTTLVLFTIVSLEEISQAFIPTRSCDIIDWLADVIGLGTGQTAAIICKSLCRKKHSFDQSIS